MNDPKSEAEWRCGRCGTLLGVRRGRRVHIKHRRAQLIVRGSVMYACPRCGELTETDTIAVPEGTEHAA
jgi:uncharacterized C2H2 Zn-finger protein